MDLHCCLEQKEASATTIVPLSNRYEALGLKKEERLDSSLTPGNNKHIKQDRLRNHIKTSTNKKG